MFKKLLILTFLVTFSFAEVLKIGDKLTPLTLKDQFDKENIINSEKYQTFLISFSKDNATRVNQFLEDKKKGFLDEHKIVFISDIHKMPSLITSFFALPKMKKFDYKVMLMYEENKVFPYLEDALSVVKFKNNKVVSIEFIKENESINAIFN